MVYNLRFCQQQEATGPQKSQPNKACFDNIAGFLFIILVHLLHWYILYISTLAKFAIQPPIVILSQEDSNDHMAFHKDVYSL